MGSLIYPTAGHTSIEIDDRVLAHLQVVISSKLRQRQSFFLSWIEDIGAGSGRASVWIDPSIQLTFKFATNERHQMNRRWLELMMKSANSAGGLFILEEPVRLAIAAEPALPDVVAA